MKLAFQGTLNYGGQGTFLTELTRHLAPRVESVDIFPSQLSLPYQKMLDFYGQIPENVKIHPGSSFIKSLISDPFQFKYFDLIHINYAILGLPAMFSRMLYGTKYVYTCHYTQTMGKSLWHLKHKIEYDFFTPIVAKRSSAFVTISNYCQDILKKNKGVQAKVIYNGVNFERFQSYNRNKCKKYLIDSLGLSHNDTILLFVGLFYDHKDIPTLLNALSKLKSFPQKLKLIIVGSGNLKNLRKLIKSYGVEEDVILAINISDDDLANYYSGSDMFVFPSLGEGFGLVVLEAMASGLPVIIANAGATPEVVGDAGMIFEPRNSEDLALKIRQLINDKSLYYNLKEKGLKRVKYFAWDDVAEEYYELYNELLRGRQPE